MLTFESPFYEIGNVIVFRDHASPTMFHYLAAPPRLTRDERGKPSLLLLKYRHALEAVTMTPRVREQLGGAFLMFGVDCGLTQAIKDDIIRQLQARVPPGAGPVSLAPVLYTKGKVHVIALDAQQPAEGAAAPSSDAETHSKFVRGVLGTATPSLLQDQRAIFSLSLTPDAAALIEEAYQSEMSPIGVMYELEFAGLRPALSVRAKVDKQQVYESLKLGLHIGVGTGGDAGAQGQRPAEAITTTPAAGGTSGGAARPATGTTTGAAAGGTTGGATGATTGATIGAAGGTTGAATGGTTGTQAGNATVPGATTTTPATSTGTADTAKPKPGVQIAVEADIGYAVEKLRQSGAIEIEIIQQQEGKTADDMRASAMQLIKESILKEFYSPAMSASSSPAAGVQTAANAAQALMGTSGQTNQGIAGNGTRIQAAFQLQIKNTEELRTETFDYSVTAPETRTHAPNGFFSALVGATEKANCIRTIDLDDAFFKTLDVDVSTTADFAAFDIKTIVVDLQYGGTETSPRVAGSATFTTADAVAKHFQAFRDLDDFTYRHRVAYNFGQSDEIAAQRQSWQTPWRSTLSRALVAHPPEDVPMLRVFVEPGLVEWDIVRTIEARLSYDDPVNRFRAARKFLVTKDSPRQPWIVRLTDSQRRGYQVQLVWHLADGRSIEGTPRDATATQLFVEDPFEKVEIPIIPLVDPRNVTRIEVELHYADPANHLDIRRTKEFVAPNFGQEKLVIPIINRDIREYTYRVSLIKANGGVETQPERRTDQQSIAITEGGVYFDVAVTLVGNMAQLGIDALELDLRTDPLDGGAQKIESLLFDPASERKATPRLLLRADLPTPRFEYKTIAFRAADPPIESDWIKHDRTVLLLQLQRLVTP